MKKALKNSICLKYMIRLIKLLLVMINHMNYIHIKRYVCKGLRLGLISYDGFNIISYRCLKNLKTIIYKVIQSIKLISYTNMPLKIA